MVGVPDSVVAKANKKLKYTVTVTASERPTGEVTVFDGTTPIATATLDRKDRGSVTIDLPRLSSGKTGHGASVALQALQLNAHRHLVALREGLGGHADAGDVLVVLGPVISGLIGGGASRSTVASPRRTTMSPPPPSPAKFSDTRGLASMLRIRAPAMLYIATDSLPSHTNHTGMGSGDPDGVIVVNQTTISSRRWRATRVPNSVL